MQFTASSHITQQPGEQREVGVYMCVFVRAYWGRWCTQFKRICFCVSVLYLCTYVWFLKLSTNSHRSHCCDPAPGAGRQSQAPLTGGSTISHSSADGPVYSETHRNTERMNRRHKNPTCRQTDIILFDYKAINWLFGREWCCADALFRIHTDWCQKSPTERPSQLKRDCRVFRDLIKKTVGWPLLRDL